MRKQIAVEAHILDGTASVPPATLEAAGKSDSSESEEAEQVLPNSSGGEVQTQEVQAHGRPVERRVGLPVGVGQQEFDFEEGSTLFRCHSCHLLRVQTRAEQRVSTCRPLHVPRVASATPPLRSNVSTTNLPAYAFHRAATNQCIVFFCMEKRDRSRRICRWCLIRLLWFRWSNGALAVYNAFEPIPSFPDRR